MSEVYILIHIDGHDILGVFTSKRNLMCGFRKNVKEYIDYYLKRILEKPESKEEYVNRIKEVNKVLDYSDDELFDLIMSQDKNMPKYLSDYIHWYKIEKFDLDFYYSYM